MEPVNTQKKAEPAKSESAARQFVVRGESKIYPGTHFLGVFGGFMPYDGGFGRLSEERCRENIKRFATREEAQARSDENNALVKRVFTATVEEEPCE